MSCRKLAVLISGLAILAVLCEAVPAPAIIIESGKQQNNAFQSKDSVVAPTEAIEADDLKSAASGHWGHSYGHGFGHGHGHGFGHGHGHGYGYWGGHYPYLGGFYGSYPYAGYGYGGYGSYGHGLYGGYGGYWL